MIIPAFESCGLYPIDRKKLLSVHRPNDMNDVSNLISVQELVSRFIQKWEQTHRNIVGSCGVTERPGFLDTKRGLVLTTD